MQRGVGISADPLIIYIIAIMIIIATHSWVLTDVKHLTILAFTLFLSAGPH